MADDPTPSREGGTRPSLGALKGKKLLGLPLPLMLGGLAVGVAVAVYFRRRNSSPAPTELVIEPTVTAGDGFQLPTDPKAVNAPAQTRPPQDNGEWTQLAIRALIAAGTAAYLAQQVIDKYLQGGQQLTAEEAALISKAIGDVGPPPFPPAAGPAPLAPVSPPQPTTAPTGPPAYQESPGYTEVAPIVSRLSAPGGGEWQLSRDGAIFALGSAPYLGGANGKTYFAGRTAVRLKAHNRGVSPGYTIVANNGQEYSYPEGT